MKHALDKHQSQKPVVEARFKNPRHLPALIGVVPLLLGGVLTAQTFTTLHSFSAIASTNFYGVYTNNDGANPHGRLVLRGDTLYGATSAGGSSGMGTLFKINTDGSGFAILHTFVSDSNSVGFTNQDGGGPTGLLLSDNTLYGTCSRGGLGGSGTVFKVNADGTGFATLYSFTPMSTNLVGVANTNGDGAASAAGLIISGSTLYGTTAWGGSAGVGTVFAIKTDGTGFTNLYNFPYYFDGGRPLAELFLSGSTLFGTASDGGNDPATLFIYGTVFALQTDGTGFTTLHYFFVRDPSRPPQITEGGNPQGALLGSGNTLYGTAAGGYVDGGTVFKLSTDGSGFTILHGFTSLSNYVNNSYSYYFNQDGYEPWSNLVLLGNTLYGTTQLGGDEGFGVVFRVA
ncbi:MAG: choice-of-anchor tandem repeat GloVer-containing protein, partial [Limisphaerales bacterium]